MSSRPVPKTIMRFFSTRDISEGFTEMILKSNGPHENEGKRL